MLRISHLPGRVKPALYVERDGRVIPLAYFRSEWAATVAAMQMPATFGEYVEGPGRQVGDCWISPLHGGDETAHQIVSNGLIVRVHATPGTTSRGRSRAIVAYCRQSADIYGTVGRLVADGYRVTVQKGRTDGD